MTRNIKFRAWCGEMFSNQECIDNGLNPISTIGFNNEEVVWMSFTGLLDKNGKEIYEGDINANYENKKSEVVFYAGGFYLKYSKTEYIHIGSYAPFNLNVIGNIYENPKLLI